MFLYLQGEGPSQQPHDDDDDDDYETLTGRDNELQDVSLIINVLVVFEMLKSHLNNVPHTLLQEPRPSPAGKRTTSAGRSEVSSHSLYHLYH